MGLSQWHISCINWPCSVKFVEWYRFCGSNLLMYGCATPKQMSYNIFVWDFICTDCVRQHIQDRLNYCETYRMKYPLLSRFLPYNQEARVVLKLFVLIKIRTYIWYLHWTMGFISMMTYSRKTTYDLDMLRPWISWVYRPAPGRIWHRIM